MNGKMYVIVPDFKELFIPGVCFHVELPEGKEPLHGPDREVREWQDDEMISAASNGKEVGMTFVNRRVYFFQSFPDTYYVETTQGRWVATLRLLEVAV